ncbi:hypothetical protein RyT2_14090 [Pseudolactococcus yaeyamensis]
MREFLKRHLIKALVGLVGGPLVAGVGFFLIVYIILSGAVADKKATDAGANTGTFYVQHWSTDSAYTHNLLCQRYGITAEQLDGFLGTTGISYDKNRINGKRLLDWQKRSGLDVRAIVAIAQMESGYGTAGVATQPGANMFGYGAFNDNPGNAALFNDEVAVVGLTTQTIIFNKNTSFKIQDDKAKALANGTWDPSQGGVYFTDTSGSGMRRADVMTRLDKWIDEHGGTPDPPGGFGSSTGSGSIASLASQVGKVIGSGECYALTSYYAQQLGFGALSGHMNASDIGSDYNWSAKGWTVIHHPAPNQVKAGDIINFKGYGKMTQDGATFTLTQWGHTGVVSQTFSDGTASYYTQNPGPVNVAKIDLTRCDITSIIHPPSH